MVTYKLIIRQKLKASFLYEVFKVSLNISYFSLIASKAFQVINRNGTTFELETMARGIDNRKLHVEFYPSVVQYRFDLAESDATRNVQWKVQVHSGCYGVLRGP